MDASEFFHQIVEPNCENALRPPYHLRLAWNAIVSLNAVPEFIVLHRLGYETDVDRDLLFAKQKTYEKKYPTLTQLNNEAIKLKHVRRLPRKENEPLSGINSSTSQIDPSDFLNRAWEWIDGTARNGVCCVSCGVSIQS